MAEWRTERMSEWSNGGNSYIRPIYGRHTHTDDTDDDDDDDDDDDTLIFYSIEVRLYIIQNDVQDNIIKLGFQIIRFRLFKMGTKIRLYNREFFRNIIRF